MASDETNCDAPDLAPYIECLKEIKARYEIINSFTKRENHALYDVPTIEIIALQYRMIFELIALGSLAAHKSIFEQQSNKFRKMYKPNDILKELQKLNPDYYPQPIQIQKSSDTDVLDNLTNKKNGFLTPTELIKHHGMCGNLLHAKNPFGKRVDYNSFNNQTKNWASKIVELLTVHKIKLLNEEEFHLVFMHSNPDGAIRNNLFQKVNKDSVDSK